MGFLCLFAFSASANNTSLYSKIKFDESCRPTYDAGYSIFQEVLKGELSKLDLDLLKKKKQEEYPAECQFSFILGYMDAQNLFNQRLMGEYVLELMDLHDEETKKIINHERLVAVKEHFSDRILATYQDPIMLDQVQPENDQLFHMAYVFKQKMASIAQKFEQAIPFGRFLFVSGGSTEPLTIFQYLLNEEGKIATNKKGEVVTTVEGSYQERANKLWDMAVEVAEEYVAWEPAVFVGEDSFLYGAFWKGDMGFFDSLSQGYKEVWGSITGKKVEKPYEEQKSIREIKEEGYLERMRLVIRAAERINLKTKSFYQLYTHMLKKQKAYLERDINLLTVAQVGTALSPLVPLGMALGSMGLTGTLATTTTVEGTAITVMPLGMSTTALLGSASSFKLVGGSLAIVANVSAGLALSPMVYYAYRGWSSYQENLEDSGKDFSFSAAMDHIIGATVTSIPIALTLPPLVSSVVFTGKSLYLGLEWVVKGGAGAFSTMGEVGVMNYLKKVPGNIMRGWLKAWSDKPILKIKCLADITGGIAAEVITRQYAANAGWTKKEEAMWYYDDDGKFNLNKQGVFTIAATISMNILLKPIWAIKSLGGRFMVERFASITAGMVLSVMINSALEGKAEVDWSRLGFDQIYYSTVGNINREIERAFTFSSFLQNKSAFTQLALSILFKQVLRFTQTPLRNALMSAYIEGDDEAIQSLKDFLSTDFNVDMEEISHEEIRKIFKQLEDEGLFQS